MELTTEAPPINILKWFGRAPIALFGADAPPLSDATYLLTTGFVDLFMVQLHADGSGGARYPIGRVGTGEVLLPVRTLPAGWHLASVPSSDAAGLSMTLADLLDLAYTAGEPEASAALRRWTALFCMALPESRVQPRSPRLIAAGEQVAPSREVASLAAREASDGELLWVVADGRPALLLGRPDLEVVAGQLLPLPPPAWLETNCGVRVLSLRSAVEQGLAAAALELFVTYLLGAIAYSLEQGNQREKQRLLEKQGADTKRVHASIRQLTGTLGRGADHSLSPNAALGNALMSALDAIGNAQGIPFQAPPELVRGAPLRDPVASIARASGVRYRRVVLSTEGWNQSESPFLAFRESDRAPLACIPKSGKKYDIYDPATDQKVALTRDILVTLEPFAYLFYRPFPAKQIKAKDLMLFGIKGSWKDIFTIILVGLLGSLLGLGTPIVTGTIFDSIIPGAQRSRLVLTAFILGAASVSSVLFNLARSFAILRVEGKMDSRIQAAIWDRLLGLPVPFFRRFSAGDLASRGLAISSIRQILTGSALSSIMSGIFSISSFCLLFYYSSHLAWLASGLTLIALLVTTACSYLQLRQQREMLELHGRLTGTVLQFLMGIAKLRVSGTENRAFFAWAGSFARQKMLSVRSRRVSNVLGIFNAAFPTASMIGIFYLTASEMAKPGSKPLSTGDFLAFLSAYGQFSGAVLSLTTVFLSLLSVVPLYERARPILDALPEVDASKPHVGDLSGAVELNHVNFRYREDGPLILKDISLDVKPGEFVAFVGPSGAGKSTLFRLFLGFDVPESGAIYFDGQDLQSVDIQSVRQQMGVVIQNASLFSGDIYSNITCSAPYTIDEAGEAARLAGFEKDLRAMPMGLHTVVGEGGAGLSGGQRQRLMIARAIVGRPRVLLFDEATSALDNQTQAIVSKSLEDLNSTRIVIAHRLSTIVNADRIYVLEAGAVVQSGTYAELIGQSGLFADLAKRQLA